MLVDIDMSKLSDKTERLNICLSPRALRRLDSLAANLAKTIFSLKALKRLPTSGSLLFFLVYSRNLPRRLNYGRIPLLRACEWLSLVAAEPLGVDLVVGAVDADFVEGLVKTGAQLVVALAGWQSRSFPPSGHRALRAG